MPEQLSLDKVRALLVLPQSECERDCLTLLPYAGKPLSASRVRQARHHAVG
jgi:hypothetical protein